MGSFNVLSIEIEEFISLFLIFLSQNIYLMDFLKNYCFLLFLFLSELKIMDIDQSEEYNN